jgi:hypothetical protein
MSVIITQNLNKINTIKFDWTADSNGDVLETYLTSSQMKNISGWYVNMAITIPKSPSPTNLYDIELLDENDFDIFGGKLLNRSNTTVEQAIPQIITGVLGPRQVNIQPLLFKLTNNIISGAKGSCQIFFVR